MFSNTDAEWLNRGGHVRLIDRVKLKLGQETETIAGFLLWQVSKLWQHRLTLALRDLRPGQHTSRHAGKRLRFSEEGLLVRQSLLSKATKVDRMTASQTLRSLEQKRPITRQSSDEDLQTHRMRLTPTRSRDRV
jgi:hypothetical protein